MTCAFLQHYSCNIDKLDKEISIIEVEHAIKLLRCGKSPGQDNVLNECIKYGGLWITHFIARLFNHLYNLGVLPDEWSKGLIVPIYKKRDTQQPANYRPITLLSSLCKLDYIHLFYVEELLNGQRQIMYLVKHNLGSP